MDNSCAEISLGRGASRSWLAGGLVVVTILLALALASDRFQATLNSDYLLAQVFSHALTDSAHPISGWKFGSATFWFPDYALYLPLQALCGNSGLSYPLYATTLFLLLGAMMAWSLAAAGVEKITAIVAGFLALDGVLLCQGIPGHADWLWRLGVPAYHGGNLVNGFALLALALGAVRDQRWSGGRSVAAVAVMTLGLSSNALLFFHWMIPLVVALFWQTRPVLTGFLRRAGLALALAALLRVALAIAEIFFFQRLVRDWPLPELIWRSLTQFFTDLFENGMFTSQWLFWVLAALAITAAVNGLSSRRHHANTAVPTAWAAGLAGLLFAWATPMAAVYWHDATSFRYLLNWLVVPAWMLALWLCTSRARWLPGAALAIGVLGAALAIPRIAVEKLYFPRPPEMLALRDYCDRHKLREGLADFWHGHYLNVAWDFSGPRLSNIRDEDFAYFWCNNAFAYFPPADDGRALRPPAPQFVILDGLDRARLAERLGGTLRIEQVGPYAIALLTAEQTRRAGELIAQQAREFLKGRRADWLETQVSHAP